MPERTKQAVQTLTGEERMLLWAIRVWVAHFKRGTPPCAGFARCFAAAGAPGIADSLDALLALASRHAHGAIDINCAQCRDVSGDERDWLAAVAAVQHGDVARCRQFLGARIAPAASDRACGLLAKLAIELRRAGLVLPLRAAACPDAGRNLIH